MAEVTRVWEYVTAVSKALSTYNFFISKHGYIVLELQLERSIVSVIPKNRTILRTAE
jgi:hypothetical protein